MARRRRAPTGLVAAGVPVQLDRGFADQLAQRQRSGWQREAWTYFHAIGELKYATRFQSELLSRAKFFAAVVSPEADVPVPVEQSELTAAARDAVLEEFGRIPDISELVRHLVVHWQVPGEAYVIVREDGTWDVATPEQIRTASRGGFERWLDPRGERRETLDRRTTALLRVWQRDEQWPELADSPMRAILYEAEELLILGRHIRAVARSRIANNGVLLVPSEIDFGPDDEIAPPEGNEGLQPASRFERLLRQALTEPISNEGSAAAITPILVRGPAEYLQAIRHFTMERSIDATIDARMDRLLVRMARAWNLPPERVLGMSGTTFANASQIERSEWDAHLAPLGEALGLALAKAWLRPVLVERGLPPEVARRVTIAVDPARAVTNPTLANDAKDAHKAFAISDEALRRALGFDEGDAPDEDELARRVAIQRGRIDPEVTTEMLGRLLAEVAGSLPAPSGRVGVRTADDQQTRDERRERPRRTATPVGGQDRNPREAPAAVLADRVRAAAPFALARAREQAGARAKAAAQGTPRAAEVRNRRPAEVLSMDLAPDVDLRACTLGTSAPFAAAVADWCRELGLAPVDVSAVFEEAVLTGDDAAVVASIEAMTEAADETHRRD